MRRSVACGRQREATRIRLVSSEGEQTGGRSGCHTFLIPQAAMGVIFGGTSPGLGYVGRPNLGRIISRFDVSLLEAN